TNIEKNTPIVNGLESLNYEVKILLREVEKNRKLMPVRKLFENIPNLILNLKPCIMMSPLSVSTYLKNLDYKFDVVIFDEASQIQPESALGAIYRSKQTIIVGDSEQLPPTNFFQNIDKTDSDDNDVDSFESILNIAKASMDKVSLKWHYRSKFEELIYTSNSEIYKNLITFPAKNKPGKNEGLEFIYLNGIYENSENKIEALKVANLVKEHFYTYGFNRSIGIVTFNEQQQRLIEQEIDKMRRLNRSLDEYFSSNLKEPFFVKNIETVQGDERDTIIISIGYGPAPITKKISMNFGPLNKDGGYRRLNVAISRSKLNLKVVSSIRSSDIDLSKTDARGVKFLKEFLRISETRLINDLEKSVDGTKNFANDVSFELEKLGYEVDFNLGTSNYKIDLAVKNKNNKNEYILGIELDGSVYKIDDNARARERLKKEVLESRGWNIYRIWSVDWFRNKELELRRLVDQLENRFIHVDLNNTSEEVILEYVNEDTSLLDTFASYPNYDNLIKEVNTNNTLNDIRTIIKTLEPVHLDELKKIVPKYYDREVYSKYVDKKFIVDLDILIYKEYLFNKDNDYIVSPNQSIYFRKTTINSTRRNFLNIHDLEIRDGIIAILKIVKIIEVEALTKKILEFSGYTNSSIEIRKKIDNILKTLVDEKIIIISKNLINYINE
ncbi:AAA domain-containing protein, partial [Haploplasma modicum]|uniref:AAA domain-containing protein n=1 Tax=Haploplasma modicum TaxID=2150 RepID=UPI00214B0464